MDRILLWLAWRIPRRLVYHCGVRIAAHATSGVFGKDEVPLVTVMDALARWETKWVVYRAVLDERTCSECQKLDGRVFEVGTPSYKEHMPPSDCLNLRDPNDPEEHTPCRCVYVSCLHLGGACEST